jgi:hypothetical protein
MTREELFELLEMDSAEDFGYFEQFAELLECEDEIAFEDFLEVLSKVDTDNLIEINENYFTETEKAIPEGCDDFYEVMQSIWDNLKELARDADDREYRREYVTQLYRFHEMYTSPEGASVDGEPCSVMEALAENRASKLDGSGHVYDFENSLDYVPDYISMRLGGFEEDEDDSDDTM